MAKDLPMFYDDYQGHEFVLTFVQHPNGVLVEVKASNLPVIRGDAPRPTYENAKEHGIAESKRLIDELIKSQ